MAQLEVLRHGHVNHFTADYDATLAFYRDVLGGTPFMEWEEKDFGARNALISVGPLCIELFSPVTDGPIASWVASRGAGWHSMEWTVPALPEAIEAVDEQGLRITDRTDSYVFTHPKDFGGLCLEITHHLFPDDPRGADGPLPGAGTGADLLGFVGGPEVHVATRDVDAAAERMTALTGRATRTRRHVDLHGIGRGVDFGDHLVEHIGVDESGTGSVATRLADHSEGIMAVVLPVADVEHVAGLLRKRGVDDAHLLSSDGVLWLLPDANQGACIGFRAV